MTVVEVEFRAEADQIDDCPLVVRWKFFKFYMRMAFWGLEGYFASVKANPTYGGDDNA